MYLTKRAARCFFTDGYKYFLETVSVTNGLGYTNAPPGGAESGTAFFFIQHQAKGSLTIFY